jgi:hypothetical protein
VESLSTGKIQTFEVTSDEDGIITVEDVALELNISIDELKKHLKP